MNCLHRIVISVVGVLLATVVAAAVQHGDSMTVPIVGTTSGNHAVRFQPIEVWIDTGATTLAAYQVEIAATRGNVQIVGIEGGSHPLFKDPPFYDNRAMQNDRVIVADFSTAVVDQLPVGRVRLVTLHLQVTGSEPVEFVTELQAASDADGNAIDATVVLVQETQS